MCKSPHLNIYIFCTSIYLPLTSKPLSPRVQSGGIFASLSITHNTVIDISTQAVIKLRITSLTGDELNFRYVYNYEHNLHKENAPSVFSWGVRCLVAVTPSAPARLPHTAPGRRGVCLLAAAPARRGFRHSA